MGSQTPLNIALGVFAGNVVYLIFIFILTILFSATPVEIFTGSFSGIIDTLVSVLIAIGGLLVVADLVIVGRFISSISGGSW